MGFLKTSGKKTTNIQDATAGRTSHQVLEALSFFQGPAMTFFVAVDIHFICKNGAGTMLMRKVNINNHTCVYMLIYIYIQKWFIWTHFGPILQWGSILIQLRAFWEVAFEQKVKGHPRPSGPSLLSLSLLLFPKDPKDPPMEGALNTFFAGVGSSK